MTVLVFANGEIEDARWIEPHLSEATAVLAADGGLRHIMALGRWPDVIIGDMDSLPEVTESELSAAGVRMVRYSHDKNETDLELALNYAAENYAGPIRIFGATGGRLDQTLANISLLALPSLVGRDVRLVGPNEQVWLVGDHQVGDHKVSNPQVIDQTEIQGEVGDTVSLVPLGGDVVIADTTGLRWPLHDETLHFGRARGVSNEMVSTVATVSVAAGQVLCIHMTRH